MKEYLDDIVTGVGLLMAGTGLFISYGLPVTLIIIGFIVFLVGVISSWRG